MARKIITRIGDWPEKPRSVKEILRLLDEGEISPTLEAFDEQTQSWRPLSEIEPFAEHLRLEEEMRRTLSADEYAKRKRFRRPVRYTFVALGILALFVAAVFAMATVFDVFAEGLGGLPEVPEGEGEKLWIFEVGEPVGGSPFYWDGSVYFGAEDGYIYRVDAETGEGVWRYEIGRPVLGEVLIVDGRLYVGTCAAGVWCLDAESGERLWSCYTGHYVGGGVHYHEGRLYFGSYDHNVYCCDALTGELLWSFESGGWVFSTPFVDDGRCFVGSYDGHLYCLDAETGSELWRYRVNGEVRSSPYAADGRVYFGAADSRLHCLDAADGEMIWRFRDPKLWNYIRGRVVVFDGRVYFGSLNGKFYALDAESGEMVWSYKTRNSVETGGIIVGTLADGRRFNLGHSHRWIESGEWPEEPADEQALAVFGSADGNLYCLNARDGELYWIADSTAHVLTDPCWNDQTAYFGSQDGNLYAVRSWLEKPENEEDPTVAVKP